MADAVTLAELDAAIAVVRDNLRELVEQAAAFSGAADEARNADRIASSAVPTVPSRSSITRPGSRRRASKCAWACRRSSHWKQRSCASAAPRAM